MTETVPTGSPISQSAHADGRIELAPGAFPAHSPFANEDLRPVPVAERKWTTYNFAALWISMAHCIPSWTLASGLVALGMDWKQAVFTIALANVIVLLPMLATGHAGPKYGIPFPVLARASFGLRGANIPAMIRAAVACGWFGIQTWIGGSGIFALGSKLTGGGWENASRIAGNPWPLWLCFLLFWAVQIAIIYRGMDFLRHFENWAAPFVIVGAFVLLIWIAVKADGFGALLDQPSKLGWGADFWPVFFPSLMGMIGFWATLSLNIPDFTRFGASQKAQTWGQSLGLPTTMTLFAILAVLVTSGSEVVYGEAIWDPVALAAKTDNAFGLLFALVIVLVATVSVNIAANVVSPAYDLANLAPKLINFRTGALITGVVGILIFPWKLISTPEFYIFTWLGVVGGLLGTVAGILIADYWIVRRTVLHLVDLYTPGGRYWYSSGWNWRAIAAFLVGGVLAVGGSYSGVGADGARTGPFPADGLIPFLKPLADYGWAVGLGASLVLYVVLMLPKGRRQENLEA
ncbi:NCS1 family nucleobase:cation symporter-1 [Streptomyces sp. ISL-22]|uniref:NCS1 family nucleobase:cation symporter-1 n=1 Tax=unclassified Streptomyces TaxID=2593676 RepID=UPI001BE70DBF|nr:MULTISPECIES: NCS1 family nucleobase:cation symporter-1 [unclassified Streptomyces]MBT2418807.1 NCS1 family nucleobase:cation symporter-1 [Streptomyces sp. ISL-24]MBT2431432.1 NCS1 family nucleobase:cation symporter-1 [Streptomyces sp. ISL-22]